MRDVVDNAGGCGRKRKRKERLLGGRTGRNTPCRLGCVEGDRPDGERDVSVPGGGTQCGLSDIRRNDFAGIGPYPTYILPSTKL